MALQMQMSFPQYGFSATNAYLKVGDLQVSEGSNGWGVNFTLKAYFSATAKSNGKAPITISRHFMTYSATSANQDQYNIVKCAYEYLKTLSEFSGATDV
tara:strand:- start:439 stop:735 length:297 start_codon:yes stop_codon:yes gene_type:complete